MDSRLRGNDYLVTWNVVEKSCLTMLPKSHYCQARSRLHSNLPGQVLAATANYLVNSAHIDVTPLPTSLPFSKFHLWLRSAHQSLHWPFQGQAANAQIVHRESAVSARPTSLVRLAGYVQ